MTETKDNEQEIKKKRKPPKCDHCLDAMIMKNFTCNNKRKKNSD